MEKQIIKISRIFFLSLLVLITQISCYSQENRTIVLKTHIYEYDPINDRTIDLYTLKDINLSNQPVQWVYCYVVGHILVINYYTDKKEYRIVLIDLKKRSEIFIPEINKIPSTGNYTIFQNGNYLMFNIKNELAIYKYEDSILRKIGSNIKVIDPNSKDYFKTIIINNDDFFALYGHSIIIYSQKNGEFVKSKTINSPNNALIWDNVVVSDDDIYFKTDELKWLKIYCYNIKTNNLRVVYTQSRGDSFSFSANKDFLIISDEKQMYNGHLILFKKIETNLK